MTELEELREELRYKEFVQSQEMAWKSSVAGVEWAMCKIEAYVQRIESVDVEIWTSYIWLKGELWPMLEADLNAYWSAIYAVNAQPGHPSNYLNKYLSSCWDKYLAKWARKASVWDNH